MACSSGFQREFAREFESKRVFFFIKDQISCEYKRLVSEIVKEFNRFHFVALRLVLLYIKIANSIQLNFNVRNDMIIGTCELSLSPKASNGQGFPYPAVYVL